MRSKTKEITLLIMRFCFGLLLTLCLLTPPSLRAQPQGEVQDAHQASITLQEKDIKSWREVEQGFHLVLNGDARSRIKLLTEKNLNMRIDIFIEHLLVGSPIVRSPFDGGNIMLSVDEKMKEKILPLLPSERRGDNDE